MNLKKEEEYILMNKKTGRVILDGNDRRIKENQPWSLLGFEAKDLLKMTVYLCVAVYYGTRFYIETDNMKDFIATQTAINAHFTLCNDNRDKWATLKNGHIFECGAPKDGWTPNMGKI